MSWKVGALWTKTYEDQGRNVTYYSGQVELGLLGKQAVTLFQVKEKKAENQPDYRLVGGPKEQSRQVGVFWKRTMDKEGGRVAFLTGEISLGLLDPVGVSIFPNDRKKESTHPDYTIVLKRNGDTAKETNE